MGDEVLVLVPLLIVMGEGGKHLKKSGSNKMSPYQYSLCLTHYCGGVITSNDVRVFFCFFGACVFVCAYVAHERSGHHADVGEQSETRST